MSSHQQDRRQLLAAVSVTAAVFLVAAIVIAVVGVHGHRSQATSLYPSAKESRIEHVQSEISSMRANPRPKPNPSQALSSVESADSQQPEPSRSPGIIDMRQGPFPAAGFVVRNFYQGPVTGTWDLVYAGATRDEVSGALLQPAVRIYAQTTLHDSLTEIGTFPAPGASGALTITAVKGTLLTLQCDTGQAFTFDLSTDQYQ